MHVLYSANVCCCLGYVPELSPCPPEIALGRRNRLLRRDLLLGRLVSLALVSWWEVCEGVSVGGRGRGVCRGGDSGDGRWGGRRWAGTIWGECWENRDRLNHTIVI